MKSFQPQLDPMVVRYNQSFRDMARTALYNNLATMGARIGEYRGAETALSFGDARAEFTSLLRDCGVYDLGWRTPFRISGRDRVRWLNGMVSNNVRDLPPGRGNYNFMLNAQGRVLGDLYIYNRDEDFLAATEAVQLENLLKLLRKYIIMDQVELTDLSGELVALGVQGPRAQDVLTGAAVEGERPQSLQLVDAEWHGHRVTITRMAGERCEAYEIWMAPALASAIWDALIASGGNPVGMDALEMFRIAAGVPRYGVDIRDRDLPQETAQMQALNFSKGCYIGQEIVERIHSRGSVHRTFTGLVIAGPPPATGAKVIAAGKEVGEITSALVVPALNADGGSATLALGYLRREHAAADSAVQVGGVNAAVANLPFTGIL